MPIGFCSYFGIILARKKDQKEETSVLPSFKGTSWKLYTQVHLILMNFITHNKIQGELRNVVFILSCHVFS